MGLVVGGTALAEQRRRTWQEGIRRMVADTDSL
jgi:hypothetical protein